MQNFALFLVTALALAGQASAQTAAARPCIPGPEAEALMLVVLPEILRSAQQVCTPHLPAGAVLTRPDRIIARYQAEATGAWPRALSAMEKLTDPQTRQMLDGELGRQMLPAMVGPLIVKDLKPADCGPLNRTIELLEPLPARNAAGAFVSILQLSGQKTPEFQICAFVPGRRG